MHGAGDKAGLNGEGLEPVGLHDLRHSLVAIAFEHGLTAPEVAVLARHANANVTLAVYAGITGDAGGARVSRTCLPDSGPADSAPGSIPAASTSGSNGESHDRWTFFSIEPGRPVELKLHEYSWGAKWAPEITCLHGVRAHGLRFARLAEGQLAGRFHVRSLDLRGHGYSSWDPPWTIEAHVGDLLDSVTEPGIWIGHSFGARLVTEITARHSDLVERAVLLDPALWLTPDVTSRLAVDELSDLSFASAEEAVDHRLQTGDLIRTPRAVVEQEMAEHLVEGPDGRLRYRYSGEAVAVAWREMSTDPPAWERLKVPTLLVVASHSKHMGAGEVELFRAALSGLLTVVVVPGGHSVLWDAPEETATAIDAFLAG